MFDARGSLQPAAPRPATSRPAALPIPLRSAPLGIDDPSVVSAPLGQSHILFVTVGWGTSILAALSCQSRRRVLLVPSERVPLSSRQDKSGDVRLFVPAALEGDAPVPLCLERDGQTRLVVPSESPGRYRERARAKLAENEGWLELSSLLDRGHASPEVPGAMELPLVPGAEVELEAYGLWFSLRVTPRATARFRGLSFDRSFAGYLALSLATCGSLLGSLAYFAPPLALEDEGRLDKDRLILLQQYLTAAAQREIDSVPAPSAATSETESGGKEAAPAPGEPGESGRKEAERAPKRTAVAGPVDQPTVTLSREESLVLARDFGMIGMLRSGAMSAAPFSPFSRDLALGSDPESAWGDLWSADIGDAAGQNGLHLSGDDFGGLHGPSTGIGIDGITSTIGSFGKCEPGAGQLCDFGRSVGRTPRGRTPSAPSIRTSLPTTNGRLPAEVVQRIVRQNFGRFRFCYEQGLAKNPNLEGRVAVRFVIDRTGGVSTASPEPGGLPDSAVSRCVAQGFLGLSFPPPEAGIVTVTYPLLFSPG